MDHEKNKTIHDLHMLAAEAQIHHNQFLGGALSIDEYVQKVDNLRNHEDITTEPHHAERDSHYRDMIINIKNISERFKS